MKYLKFHVFIATQSLPQIKLNKSKEEILEAKEHASYARSKFEIVNSL